MVLDFLKRLFGPDELDPYERDVLEREHRELASQIASKRQQLGKVETTRSKKKMNPQATHLLKEIDRLERRQREIEKQLGGKPEGSGRSRRRSKRGT